MLFRALPVLIVACAAFILATGQSAAQSVRDRLAKDVVVATVNGEQILSGHLLQSFQNLPRKHRQRGLRAVYGELLEQLIENRLLTYHGRENNLSGDAEVQALVKEAEDQIIARVYLNRLVSQSITDSKLKARYEELVKNTPSHEEVRARHILVSTEQEAKEVLRFLDGGQPFEEVAKTHSKDPAASRGGDLGYFRSSDMVKQFSAAAFAMKPGETSASPVKTEFGWHVIKVEDRRQSSVPPFERVRPQIARDLGRRIAIEILNAARNGADIQRFTLDGQPLPPPSAQQQPAKK